MEVHGRIDENYERLYLMFLDANVWNTFVVLGRKICKKNLLNSKLLLYVNYSSI